jgi:hypothetical protein
MKITYRQRGAHTVEFAIVGSIFFLMLFGVIEVGRLLYAMQVLDEASRRAARVATVCPVNDEKIKHVAVFNEPDVAGASPVLSGLTDQHVHIDYLNQSGGTSANYDEIRFVRARIQGYSHTLLIPMPTALSTVPVPEITTVLPRESLGVWPAGTGCLGTYM